MKLAVAADHGGYELKRSITAYLVDKGIEVLDLGTGSPESVDYPAFGRSCGEVVASGEADAGIVICGTGIGVSIAANKVKGIRCALVVNVFMAEMAKKHNNANVIALGGRMLSDWEARDIVEAWLSAKFEEGRHRRRVDMLDRM